MGENSGIEWTDNTFNPWIGCTRVSPACDACYAEAWASRFGTAEWGPGKPRKLTSEKNWNLPLKWDQEAEKSGTRRRVFCASLADVFDNEVDPEWRERLWKLIAATPHLDWLLLTKRVGNVPKMLPATWGSGWRNVWLGITVANQEEANRDIPKLLDVPARIRFLSMEPLLGPVDLTWLVEQRDADGEPSVATVALPNPKEPTGKNYLDWVIVGGESGRDARPMHPDWARSLRDQCVAAGVPYLFKQWGEWAPHRPVADGDLGGDVRAGRVRIMHPTGESDVEVFQATGRNTLEGSRYMARVGKKVAGRLLDGREWNELPVTA